MLNKLAATCRQPPFFKSMKNNRPYNILIYFAVYERLNVLKVCLESINRLRNYKPDLYNVTAFAVCSNENESALLEEYNIDHIIHENKPLGRKKNAGLDAACKLDFDYLIEIGSDDIINHALLDFYEIYFASSVPAFGLNSCYIVDTELGKTARFTNSYAIGAGRCFSKKVLLETKYICTAEVLNSVAFTDYNYGKGQTITVSKSKADKLAACGIVEIKETTEKGVSLWSDDANAALDSNSHQNLYAKTSVLIQIVDCGLLPLVIDLKSKENINSFDKLSESGFLTNVQKDINLFDFLNVTESELLNNL